MGSRKPPGIRLLEATRRRRRPLSFASSRAMALALTFVSYAAYHATRKTPSIVKGVLDPSEPNAGSGWPPFSGPGGAARLGEIDLAFLGSYSAAMFFAGHLGDRVDLRLFLAAGMVGTGLLTAAFGAAYWLGVHSFYYFLAVQVLAGVFQSTGWPAVVPVVGNWLGGTGDKGLVMGIWNANTSVGSISGSLVAAALLRFGWGWSFVVPGAAMALLGLVVWAFLSVEPEAEAAAALEPGKGDAEAPLVEARPVEEEVAVGFLEACRIPGVATFALCLFFSKLVAYTFMYWLPFYISHTAIGGRYLPDSTAGLLSSLFDVGGVAGGVLAGHLSDRLNARALTAALFTTSAVPALYLYRALGGASVAWNAALMLAAGALVNGPYALITTAVSAELGRHDSLRGSARAMSTVSAIINGTGSVGAAVGPLLTGYISGRSWAAVFYMLMAAALVAGLLLSRLVMDEVLAKVAARRSAAAAAARSDQLPESACYTAATCA